MKLYFKGLIGKADIYFLMCGWQWSSRSQSWAIHNRVWTYSGMRVQPHSSPSMYKGMPSTDGMNSVDSEDDSGKSLTFIYHDSGISLATRVFMMLKMLHCLIKVFAG